MKILSPENKMYNIPACQHETIRYLGGFSKRLDRLNGVTSAHCNWTAGLYSSCNHVASFPFRVEAAAWIGLSKPTWTSVSYGIFLVLKSR